MKPSTILLLVLLIILSACSGQAGSNPASSPTPAVALPSPSATTQPVPVARPTGTPGPTPTATRVSTPTPVTSRLILWHNLPPAQTAQLTQDIAAFNQLDSRVIIELQSYTDPAQMAQAIANGQVDYDLILGPANMIDSLRRTKKIQPMTEFFPPSFLDGFANVALSGATANDQLWALPDTAGFHLLLYYNRNLIETPPTTMQELTDFAHDFGGNSRHGLVLNSYDPLWLAPFISAYGGWLTDDAGNPTLDSEAMINALTLYQNWHQPENNIAPTLTYVEASELFNAGQAAMFIDGEWSLGLLAEQAQFPWGVIQLPLLDETGETAKPLVLGRYWAIGSETSGRKTEAATAFLEFITADERQLAWTEQFGLLPTRRTALNAPAILTNPSLRISARQLQDGIGLPLNVEADALLNAMRQPLESLLNNALSPEEAAQQMQQQAEALNR